MIARRLQHRNQRHQSLAERQRERKERRCVSRSEPAAVAELARHSSTSSFLTVFVSWRPARTGSLFGHERQRVERQCRNAPHGSKTRKAAEAQPKGSVFGHERYRKHSRKAASLDTKGTGSAAERQCLWTQKADTKGSGSTAEKFTSWLPACTRRIPATASVIISTASDSRPCRARSTCPRIQGDQGHPVRW